MKRREAAKLQIQQEAPRRDPDEVAPETPKFFADLWRTCATVGLLPLIAAADRGDRRSAFPAGRSRQGGIDRSPGGCRCPPRPTRGFSVVPATTTLRDYRKRLGYRQPRNPFSHGARRKKRLDDRIGRFRVRRKACCPSKQVANPQITETHVDRRRPK